MSRQRLLNGLDDVYPTVTDAITRHRLRVQALGSRPLGEASGGRSGEPSGGHPRDLCEARAVRNTRLSKLTAVVADAADAAARLADESKADRAKLETEMRGSLMTGRDRGPGRADREAVAPGRGIQRRRSRGAALAASRVRCPVLVAPVTS